MKKTILFICSHNSARSQMAEALSNYFFSDKLEAYSAGIENRGVHPLTIEVLKEFGIDTSKLYSKTIDKFKNINFDFVVTVCDSAKEKCPFFPGKIVIHKSFLDPSSIEGSGEERKKAFRKVRDEIKKWLEEFIREYEI